MLSGRRALTSSVPNVTRRLTGPRLLVVAMFFASFAWSFVFVSLPFHIQAISTVGPASTLRWAGWILGITSLVTMATSPVWGRFAAGGDPKRYYVAVEVLQGVGFLGMAAARTLLELFVARFALGFFGASSTFAFILAGRAPDPAEVRREVAAVQSAMTVGQVIGPLAGAVAATRLGFRPSFALGGLILLGCAFLVHRWVTVPLELRGGRPEPGAIPIRRLGLACAIVLGGSTQLFFLTSVLPQILPRLGVATPRMVEIGGLVIFVSAAGAAAGALATPYLARLTSERRLVAALLVASSLGLAALGLCRDVFTFMLVRFFQVFCIAPVFPLVVTEIAQRGGGGAIGTINSARIGAAFVGPVVATSVLAWTAPPVLYLVLAGLGLACAPILLVRDARPRP